MVTRRFDDDGSATLEFVILAPALLLIVSVLVFCGRVAIAGQAVQQAADEAAREASISRDQGEANAHAAKAARSTLSQQGLDCVVMQVSVDTRGFSAPLGRNSTVTAKVSCPVRIGDLSIPGMPGTRTVTATSVSPIDTWRER